MPRSKTKSRNYLKNKPLEVKIHLCKNRIKSLEYDIQKKQIEIEELKKYINRYDDDLKGL